MGDGGINMKGIFVFPQIRARQAIALRCIEPFVFPIIGAGASWLSWGVDAAPWRLLWILTLPVCWGLVQKRSSAYLLALGYYLSGARDMVGGATVFYGDATPIWFGLVMLILSSALLAFPFGLFWTRDQARRPGRFVIGVCAVSIPPLAIIGWLSPLTVAGTLFPHLGWAGLMLVVALFFVLAARQWAWVITLATVAMVANLVSAGTEVNPPSQWGGMDTSFAKLAGTGHDQAAQKSAALRRIDWLTRSIANMPVDSVLILPETILGELDGVGRAALQDTEDALKVRRSRVLAGAELSLPNGQYQNALVVLGAQSGEDRSAIQSIPVPVTMWKPWASDGAVADLMARGNTITVKGQRVGVAICHEQLLSFSLMRLMLDQPTVIAAVSNVWWASTTTIPIIQQQSVQAFG
ncbi:MAG: hypothetical protein V4713_12430, partial [Pseudomonadota bacterium]